MSVYRDVSHVVARIMSIETIDGTKRASWQDRYQSGFPEERASSCESLTQEERLTQDSMTRSRLHKELSPLHWYVLVAKYSINDVEVAQAIHWLVARHQSPAHHLFKTKCVTAWAIPRRLPAGFYQLHTWDNDGTPEGTLRRWRAETKRWLEGEVSKAFTASQPIIERSGLIDKAA